MHVGEYSSAAIFMFLSPSHTPPTGQAQPCCNWLSPTELQAAELHWKTYYTLVHTYTLQTYSRVEERGGECGGCLWIHPEESTARVCWFRSEQVGMTEIWLTSWDQCADDGSVCVFLCVFSDETNLQSFQSCSSFCNLSQQNARPLLLSVRRNRTAADSRYRSGKQGHLPQVFS